MPMYRDEHILMIVPGSQFTLAQLGIPESYTPPATRLRTRMFPAPDGVSWEPYKIRPIKKEKVAPVPNGDSVMGDAGEVQASKDTEEEDEFEEDLESDEGAVYPLSEGRITNMPAFLALLHHVHNIHSPTLHTPILLVAQPAWTAQDQETLTSFFFEKFKTPAFLLLDSGLCTLYGFGIESALIVDVGYQKCDITAVVNYCVNTVGRTISMPGGGDAMTNKLLELLGPKGWNKDMCEALKKSTFCEILPPGTPLPGAGDGAKEVSNPAAAASTGATASGPGVKISDAPRVPGPDNDLGDEDETEGRVDDDGVLDVASIVTSGKTQEFLAAQEKKKAAAAGRKAAKDAREAADAAAARPIRLPNSKREKVTFHYQERRAAEEKEDIANEPKPVELVPEQPNPAVPLEASAANPTEAGSIADTSVPVEDQGAKKEQARAAKREEKRKAREGESGSIRREMEVGTERFLAASGGLVDNIADAIHRTVLAIPEVSQRSAVWENVIFVGNGGAIRGFKEAVLNTLSARYLISPSSATIFTSELPSNMSTPIGTGSQTPTREYQPGQHSLPTGSSVNPLLLAATTAGNPAIGQLGGGYGGGLGQSHSSHSQSPTSIKVAKTPDYFPEFKNRGTEEFCFVGAQVAAKVFFIVDQGASGSIMSRVQYNESGPSGIHDVGMCY